MTSVSDTSTVPVRKTITVNADARRAFDVFTAGFDSWWPRTHHIGKGTLARAVIETREGGRCYGKETDGTECPWGQVLVWDPPRRLVLAWQIDGNWQYQPDLAQSSEVEVQFIAEGAGTTRVVLEHRRLERHGADAEKIRTGVDGPGGWTGLLGLYSQAADSKRG
jgi:uncharacterized protein YndB with AHSA1/START domain